MKNIEELALEALNYFKQNYDLPKTGLIAGGALSNYINHKIHNTVLCINDIDIFLFKEQQIGIDNSGAYNTRTISYSNNGVDIELSVYFHISILKTTDSLIFNFTETYRKNIINYIINETNADISNWKRIIETFDINQTQICIDIETEEVYYTSHFVEYLETQVLEIVFIQSLIHSILRCLKKSEELNVRFDHERYIVMYKEMSSFEFIQKIKNWFSEKYADIYVKHQAFFDKHNMILREDKQFYDKDNNVLFFPMDDEIYKTVVFYHVAFQTQKEMCSNIGFTETTEDGFRRVTTKLFLEMYNMKDTKPREYSLFKKFKSFFFKTNYIDLDIYDKIVVEHIKTINEKITDNRMYMLLFDKTLSEQIEFLEIFSMLLESDAELLLDNYNPVKADSLDELNLKITYLKIKNL